jgi:hypothetical protein
MTSTTRFVALLAVFLALAHVAAQPGIEELRRADVNEDAVIDTRDLLIVRGVLNTRCGAAGFVTRADVNGDCVINNADLVWVQRYVGQTVPSAPTIVARVTPPPNAAGWNNTDVTVSFACTNATLCEAPVALASEGLGQTVTGTASGPGGTATTSVTVNIDRTAPLVQITSPANGGTTAGGAVVISGTVAEGGSPLASVTCNSTAGIVDDASRTFQCETALAPGLNDIAIVVADAAGNYGGAAITVVRTSPVRINEVESSGGSPGDWIELVNTGCTPVDISGWRVRDNDDTHTYSIPAGTSIGPGSYYVVEEAALNFGLGAPDAARLYEAAGVLLDSYTWTIHAPTTYGRCPDGNGDFVTTTGVTKGAANNCAPAAATVHINEVESNGGSPGDWIELVNLGPGAADLSGWRVRDNDDTHTYILPAGIVIAPGGYYVIEEASLNFGLGAPDAVRLYDPSGTLVESFDWTAHAVPTTYGRCPNATGPFVTTNASTKGAPNDCGAPVRINEIESNDGVPGDWVELINPGSTMVDVSGFVFRDNDDTHSYVLPAGTSIAPGGYYVLEEGAFGFGLGGADSARLFDRSGILVDGYTWTAHAIPTYGRCPDGTGAFVTTAVSTKGAPNACPGGALPWPGDPAVVTADGSNVFGGNLSGLKYEGSGGGAPGTIWAVRNGPGTLFRLVWDDFAAIWTPDPANGWGAGKSVRYPDGTGNPDAEGVTFTGSGPAGGIYVSTERNNDVSGISRNSILRFDPGAPDTVLIATHEWNLTPDLPVVGANLGIEGIAWVPDSYLVARGFADESSGLNVAYDPATYPNHGGGLFFVGVEANGMIYAYALDHVTGGYTRIATIGTGLAGVMDVQFDSELEKLWAICDDGCQGRSALLDIVAAGRFSVTSTFDRPAGMPNLNNEGFTFAPLSECVAGQRPAFWSDDTETGGHAIRCGALTCSPF